MHKMSVAIESTAALTDACLQHQQVEHSGTILEEDHKLRAMFSLALIRFVNHVTEKGQNKAFAQPVHRIAQNFGIPEWIVRLRHDATHGSLPCLDVLTTGARWALTYLQDVFWSQQLSDSPEEPIKKKFKGDHRTDDQPSPSEVDDILCSYQTASHKSLDDGPESEAARDEGRALRQLEGILSSQRRNIVLACLVQPSHLLTTEDQLQTYSVTLEDTLNCEPPKVPGVLVNIWRSLLRLLQSRQLTGLLLQHLLKALLSETDTSLLHSRLIAAWLRLILLYELYNFEKSAEERKASPELYRSAIEFNTDLLLDTCLRTPSVWSFSVLPLVGDRARLSEETQSQLAELDKIYKGGMKSGEEGENGTNEKTVDDDNRQGDNTKIFSVTDLQSVQSAFAPEDDDSNVWQLCTDPIDWERVAWGLVPGHTLADTCLECNSEKEEDIEETPGSSDDEEKGSRSSDHGTDDKEKTEEPTWNEEQTSPLLIKIEVD